MRACACSRSRAGPSLAYRGGAKAAARSAWPSRMLAATPRGTAAAIYGAADAELVSRPLTTRAQRGRWRRLLQVGCRRVRPEPQAARRARMRKTVRSGGHGRVHIGAVGAHTAPVRTATDPCMCARDDAAWRGTSGSVELAAGAGGWGALAGDEGAPGARWPSGVLLPLLSQVRSRPPHVLSRTHTLSAMRARAMPGVSRAWCPALRCRAALPRLAGCAGMLLLPTRRL